jgi:hypothetical protein
MTIACDASTPRRRAGPAAAVLLAALFFSLTGAGSFAVSPVEDQVREIRERPLLAHAVSGLKVNASLTLYEFLLARPDLTASLARALGQAKYRVSPDGGNGFRGDDGKGAKGYFVLVEQGEGRRVFFARGTYDKPLLPTIAGRLVLILEYGANGPAGPGLENRVQGFVRIDTPIVGTLARIGRPLVRRAMDKKVRQLFEKVARLLDTATGDPPEALRRLAEEGPHPPEDLELLRRLLDAEHARRAGPP